MTKKEKIEWEFDDIETETLTGEKVKIDFILLKQIYIVSYFYSIGQFEQFKSSVEGLQAMLFPVILFDGTYKQDIENIEKAFDDEISKVSPDKQNAIAKELNLQKYYQIWCKLMELLSRQGFIFEEHYSDYILHKKEKKKKKFG